MTSTICLEHKNDGVASVQTSDGKATGITVLHRRTMAAPLTAAGIPETLGAYMLLDINTDPDDRFPVYVGKSNAAGFVKRISQHISSPPRKCLGWDIAILLHSKKTSDAYSENVCSALEHMLYAKFKEDKYDGVFPANTNKPPGEPTVPVTRFNEMREQIDYAMSLFKFFGVNLNEQAVRRVPENAYEEYAEETSEDPDGYFEAESNLSEDPSSDTDY